MAAEKTPNLIDPIHQFVITKIADIQIGGVDISFTNSSQFMVISTIAIMFFFMLGLSKRSIIPNRFQIMCELSYEFIANLLRTNVGDQGRAFFPFVFSLFMFIFFCNLIGLVPYSFLAGHTLFAFAGLMLSVTILGFVKHGFSFFGLFWISSAPLILRPILALIEIISYFVRPLSHSIRLAGNMMAGHAVIKVFAAFAAVLAISPFAIIAITALETFIAFLQAYIFTILTCIYLNDALHPHH